MYCEYWNLHKSPFDNVPDPSMYVDCHISMENVISETIFAIKEANECFAVIIGDVGLGKTLSLRIIIDSLEQDKYIVVLITNPSISFVQLLREIIGQITDKQCEEKSKVELLEIFNHLLFKTNDEGKKIVIFIDEANALTPANLESLRLLTNMQDDQRNLFTLVLAGQMELARRLEHPKRSNLFQRIGTYGRIDKLPDEEAVKAYIETRLKLAGALRKIFTEDCIPVIWEYSDYGVPRLINKVCKLCLKAGETNEFRTISSEVATQVAERFQKLSQTALQKRKPRSRPGLELTEDEISSLVIIEAFPNTSETLIPTENERVVVTALEIDDTTVKVSLVESETERLIPIVDAPQLEIHAVDQTTKNIIPVNEAITVEASAIETTPEVETILAEQVLSSKVNNIEQISEVVEPVIEYYATKAVNKSESPQVKSDETEMQAEDENHKSKEAEYDEVVIANHKIKLTVPIDIIEQAKSFNRESANKSAGYWAAQIIKKNPQLTHSPLVDPVSIWNEIKDNILRKIAV